MPRGPVASPQESAAGPLACRAAFRKAILPSIASGAGGRRLKPHEARSLMQNRVEATLITGARRLDAAGCTVMLHPALPANSWNFVVDVDCEGAAFAESV